MKYLQQGGFTSPANSKEYVEGWERTFGEKPDPRDVCPVCKNAIILFAVGANESACSDPECSAAHGHHPPINNWRLRSI